MTKQTATTAATAKGRPISGRATMGTVTDVEPLLRSMLLEMKRQDGNTTDVTADELKAAATAFGADLDQTSPDAADDVRETMERSLPAGVRIEGIHSRREGTRITSRTTFAFDDIRLLPALEVFFERGQQSHRPFAHLTLEDAADALVVDGMPPAFDAVTTDVPDAELKKHAVTLELELALPVVEHNATRTDGSRLVWEIDALRMRGRTAADHGWIHARFDVTRDVA